MKAIEAAARPLRWKLADAISFAVTGTYGHASDYLVEADACLSVIAALAEDDAAVADAIDEELKDMARYDLEGHPVSRRKADAKVLARAAIRAMGGE